MNRIRLSRDLLGSESYAGAFGALIAALVMLPLLAAGELLLAFFGRFVWRAHASRFTRMGTGLTSAVEAAEIALLFFVAVAVEGGRRLTHSRKTRKA